ncbi:hypothetical protein ABCY62_06480 [Acetivibrio clariflavus]|uniref:hypothetical protein n=1 Tax=Acetivibrio clariflavus TaxID=288965 RepID=UPI0031F53056
MALYLIISLSIAVVMFCINVAIFSKYKILRKDSIFIISLASIAISVLFPMILNGFAAAATSAGFHLALVTSVITSIALIVVFSGIIAYWEYIKEKGNKLLGFNIDIFTKWLRKSVLINKVKNSKYYKLVFSKKNVFSKENRHEMGKNVDTGKNIDTIGVESFDDVLISDSDISIQKSKKASENFLWNTDNPIADGCINEDDTIKELDSFVCNEDCLDDENLMEFLRFENEYGNVNIDEKSTESYLDSDCQNDSIILELEELINQSDFGSIEDSISSEINEIVASIRDEICINSDSGGNDISNNWDELILGQREEDFEGDQRMIGKKGGNELKKSLAEIIDEGFKLKEQGDYEGAIINFLYALDSHPPDDVAHWILLDICVMYKQLGQVELAKEVLDNYVKEYGIIMDEGLKYEIELNLR